MTIVDPVEVERRRDQRIVALRIDRDARRAVEAEERGPIVEPEILTLRERLARPRAEARYRIERWQPAGSRVLLAAQYKAGKTTLIGNYMRCLADGDDFLGQDFVSATATNGTIALLDIEMNHGTLDQWLADQGIRRDDKVIAIPLRGTAAAFNILDPECRSRWAKRLKVLNVEVLILDCLRPVLDTLGLDEHRDAGRFLVAFDALLKEADILDAVVVHHMGHLNERARGDSRLLDWPDVLWKLVRQDDQPNSSRFLSAYGRDVDVHESQLAYDLHTRRLTIVGGSRADAKVTGALAAVVALLKDNDGINGRAIWTELEGSGHSKHNVEEALIRGRGNNTLTTTKGPNRSLLYHCVPVSRGVPLPPPGHRPTRVSGCPAASIEAGHTGHVADSVIDEELLVSRQDTGDDWIPPGIGGRDGRF